MARQKAARLRRNIHLLRALQKAPPDRRKKLLSSADPYLVVSICDCCRNVVDKNIPLSTSQKKILSESKELLRKLSEKNRTSRGKKQLIQRGSGFVNLLPTLIESVLTAVRSLLCSQDG